MNHVVTLELGTKACKPIKVTEPPSSGVVMLVSGHPTPWVNGEYRRVTDGDWRDLVRLAREGADRTGWCTICETTIGNGSVMHDSTCLLYDPGDSNR